MKVLLIYPPNLNMITTNVPSVVNEESGCYPPLGLMYVAGAIEERTSHKVEIIDCVAGRYTYGQLEQRIKENVPDVVGIQAITFTLVDVIKVSKLIKKINASIKTVVGGPHANLYPYETIAFPEVDFVLLGEGEGNIAEFLRALESNKNFEDVPGLIYKQDGQTFTANRSNLPIGDLDSLPMPARHLLDVQRYYSVLAKGKRFTTMMTSRGCPYKCTFCDRPHLGKKFRCRSAKNVVDEMEECCKNFGIDEFFLYDDTFTVDKNRVLMICKQIKERKLKILWDIRSRVDIMDDEMLRVLGQAGCIRIHYGVESGNEDILRHIKKGITLPQVRNVFKNTRKYRIQTLAYFMIGLPGESEREIHQTIDFAKSLDADFVHFAVTTPYPGTELYRLALKSGLYKIDYWEEFAANPSKDFVPKLWEENLSRDELVSLMMRAYKDFYGRPDYILKQLVKIRGLPEFKRKIKAGIRCFLK